MNDALPDSEEYKALQQQIDELNKVLEPYGIKAPDIAKQCRQFRIPLTKVQRQFKMLKFHLKSSELREMQSILH